MLRDVPASYEEDPLFAEILMISDATPGTTTLPDETSRPVDPLDDVFGSAPSSPLLTGRNDDDVDGNALIAPEVRPAGANNHPSDIPRLRSTHVTNGYREGIAASKEKFLQEGFDEGYVVGVDIGLRAGWCLGMLEGVLYALPPSPPPASSSHVGETISRSPSSPDHKEGEVSSVLSTSSQQVAEMLRQATTELDMANLFGADFFTADGKCTFPVANDSRETSEVLQPSEIAAAHPLITKWTNMAVQLAQRFGLEISSADR